MNARVWKIAPLLFGSGFCALVYQTAWQRELRLIFGASTAASAAVLAIFMGGLGLGGILFGARVDRDKRPLAFYANLELLISLSAAVTPMLVWGVRAIYVALGGTVSLGTGVGTVMRLVLSALVLAVPTLLMGGTLPAAARAAESPDDVRRRALAVLYGLNTLGAVAGATASTFFLFEVFGTRSTLWLASLLNVVVALVAQGVARGLPDQPVSAPAPAAEPAAVTARAPARFVLASALLVGFAFFLMEMVWYRMLSPLLGGSTFTFGLILVVALAGIGLGGAAYAAWGQSRPATLRGFALTCVVEALLLAVPLALGDRVAVLALITRSMSMLGFGGLVLGWAAIAGLVVFPAAFVSGVQFPLLLALLGRGNEQVGRQVGLAYAWNTVGSIVGSLAGGFGLLPLLSAPGVWRLVGGLLVVLGLGALGLSWRQERVGPARVLPVLLVSALTALLLVQVGPTAAWRHSGVGAGRSALQGRTTNALQEWRSRANRWISWEVDGVESSVAAKVDDGVSFIVNGKSDGNSIGDAGTQVMGGLIGALAHPAPRNAMVIGLGTGSTAGWLGAVPEMERVDVVEIEPAIVEVARQCADINERVLDNPKVHVIFDDAREVLLASKKTYDIIFSEPSNPYRAGISSLFSQEFYQAVRQRLAPGGVFLQWVQAYEVDARTVRSVYATLATQFGAVETWQTMRGDVVLMATVEPMRHDLERMRARLTQEPYRRALPQIWSTDELEGVLAHYVAGAGLSRTLAEGQEALLNTDDLSFVEFAFARSVGRTKTGFNTATLHQAGIQLNAERPEVARGTVNWQRVEELRLWQRDQWPTARRGDVNLEGLRQRQAFITAYDGKQYARARELWRQGGWQPQGPMELQVVARMLTQLDDEAAPPVVERLASVLPLDAELLRVRLLWGQRQPAEAAEALARALTRLQRDPWNADDSAQDAFRVLGDLATREPARGERLWGLLARPLSNHRLESFRREGRIALAQALGFSQRCAEAFHAYEPWPTWSQSFLTQRARCYVENHDPLEERALEELAAFLAEEPPSLMEGLTAPSPGGPRAPVQDKGTPAEEPAEAEGNEP
ncbi:fused MFS/spermidine synthase [Melittangium boletus]|uniref:fused MFS/spermidine synthase n=1 Tax=Melittangium boletus TaxID=83453 RepID=UPI003DA677D1